MDTMEKMAVLPQDVRKSLLEDIEAEYDYAARHAMKTLLTYVYPPVPPEPPKKILLVSKGALDEAEARIAALEKDNEALREDRDAWRQAALAGMAHECCEDCQMDCEHDPGFVFNEVVLEASHD